MDVGYTREQYGNAVAELATGHGRIKDRLKFVASKRIAFARPDASGIPDSLRAELEAVHSRLTVHGGFDTTIDAMTEDEASAVAGKIFELATYLDDLRHQN